MTQHARLPTGGRVDRTAPVAFTFDHMALDGYAGDTVTSALLANGVHVVARSYKYHRPRGIVSAGVEEPNALLTVLRADGRLDPNVRATTMLLREGLRLRSQHCWPSLRFDLGRIFDWLSALIPAGFYYKTFMQPQGAWHAVFEPLIRRAAGLGPAPLAAENAEFAQRYVHCDVLVIGAGPAGLAAALAASEHGADVIICDEQHEFGGRLLGAFEEQIENVSAWRWVDAAASELRGRSGVRCLPGTSAFSHSSDGMIGLIERGGSNCGKWRERLWLVCAREVILATGAIERPLVFANNDCPGVMLAGAAQEYATRFAVRAGTRAVVVANHDSAYGAALALHQVGVRIEALADVRPAVECDAAVRLRDSGIELLCGFFPVSAHGRGHVRRLDLATGSGRAQRSIDCDLVLMAGGWTPTVHLYAQARGATVWSDVVQGFVPHGRVGRTQIVGAANGATSLAECLQQGTRAGHAASIAVGRSGAPRAAPNCFAKVPLRTGSLADNVSIVGRHPAFVDLQHDVTARDIEIAVREGFHSIEHVKRYTTLGMATDQGRTSSMNGLALVARLLGRRPADIGHTTFRAPYAPATFGALAGVHRGSLFDPLRRTPLDAWAAEHGAVFENVGLWRRARYFPRDGESMNAAVARECRATRGAAGLFDASTLGKIEVVGPDAAEFMNRMYTNSWSKLEVGRCRYGLMLRDDGYVFDDGVVARIALDRFHVTTTTGGAARVLHHMEDYLQTEFRDLEVWLTSTTEQWGVIALNGPRARDILRPLVEGIDLSPGAFPHMAVRHGHIAGVPTRLFRVSFTGEVGFEINVPASTALRVWEAVHSAGAPHALTVYGTETMHVLRAEKGYIIIGQETDGTVTAADLGLEWAVSRTKHDFVGKRSLGRPDLVRSGRAQLVGLRPLDGTRLMEGAQLLPDTSARSTASLGHVTSAYFSAELNAPIALGLLQDGRARHGDVIGVGLIDRVVPVAVCSPVFVDPENERLRI